MKEQEINDLINGFIRMGGYYGKYSMLLIDLRYVIEDHQEKTVNELLNSEMYKKTLEKQMEIEKEIGSNAEEDANLFRKLFYLPKFKKVWGEEAKEAEYKFEQELMSYFMNIRDNPLFELAIKEFIELGEIPNIDSTQKAFDFLLSLYLYKKKGDWKAEMETWETEQEEKSIKEAQEHNKRLYEELLKKIHTNNSKNDLV